MKASKVVIIGAGSWGTALANLVAPNCENVYLISRSESVVQSINNSRLNSKYLKELELPENVSADTEIAIACEADLVVLAIPTSAIRATAKALRESELPSTIPLITVSKGIERGSGLRMTQVISEELPENTVAALSGPNHAEEVAKNLPTCTVIGCADSDTAVFLQSLFRSPSFRSYTSQDLIGIEWGGAMKNIFAIAAGIAKGLNLGDNAISALVTRGLAEMTRVGIVLGAEAETFAGLSGLGDLVTTCYSPHSRNHQVGLALARGLSVSEAEKLLGMVAEGVRNTQSIYERAQELSLDTPLIQAVYSVIYEDVAPNIAIQGLFMREPRAETNS